MITKTVVKNSDGVAEAVTFEEDRELCGLVYKVTIETRLNKPAVGDGVRVLYYVELPWREVEFGDRVSAFGDTFGSQWGWFLGDGKTKRRQIFHKGEFPTHAAARESVEVEISEEISKLRVALEARRRSHVAVGE